MGMDASPENFLKNGALYCLFWGGGFKSMNTSYSLEHNIFYDIVIITRNYNYI
jgi:hypothetical protein